MCHMIRVFDWNVQSPYHECSMKTSVRALQVLALWVRMDRLLFYDLSYWLNRARVLAAAEVTLRPALNLSNAKVLSC